MTKTPEELTADWKEGKLKSGLYWVNFKEKIVIAECTVFGDVSRPFEIEIKTDFMIKISKVLAPVPTYDEYKAMQDHILYLEKCISIYEQKEKQHTNDSIEYNKLEKENNNLRGLLKECDGCVRCLRAYGVADCNGSNINDLITKIEEIAQKALNNESEE